MKRLYYMCLFSFFGLFSCGSGYDNLDTEAFAKAIEGGDIAIVDVRTADEYAAGHLPGAAHCDWFASDFMDKIEAAYPEGTPLAIYCRSGRRSAAAAAKLTKAGYKVSNMLGGKWLDDSLPYHAVHRLGSLPDVHGVFRAVMDWCFSIDPNIRIDTHRDNHIMQHCIESYGFSYCGIIYLESGDERLAYQRIKSLF